MDKRQSAAPGVASRYRQVYGHLRSILIDGSLDPAVALPSEPALAARYKVSRVTIRKTLELLEAEGIVRRVRGVGTYPVRRGATGGKGDISGMLDSLLSYERTTTVRNLAWSLTTPTDEVARAFGPEPCLRIVRIRVHEDRPISLTTLHVPARHATLLDERTAKNEPIIAILDRSGVRAVRAEQVITAVAADASTADHLQVRKSAPLVVMKRLMLTEDQTPVLHQSSLYAPDRFEYRMSLARGSIDSAARWTPIA